MTHIFISKKLPRPFLVDSSVLSVCTHFGSVLIFGVTKIYHKMMSGVVHDMVAAEVPHLLVFSLVVCGQEDVMVVCKELECN